MNYAFFFLNKTNFLYKNKRFFLQNFLFWRKNGSFFLNNEPFLYKNRLFFLKNLRFLFQSQAFFLQKHCNFDKKSSFFPQRQRVLFNNRWFSNKTNFYLISPLFSKTPEFRWSSLLKGKYPKGEGFHQFLFNVTINYSLKLLKLTLKE